MNNDLLMQGLMIAVIGMGLVFVMIIFLWGMMALLMRLTSGGKPPTVQDVADVMTDEGLPPEIERTEQQRRAAAAAAALGLAFASSKQTLVVSKERQKGGVSPWQAYHRSRTAAPEERRG